MVRNEPATLLTADEIAAIRQRLTNSVEWATDAGQRFASNVRVEDVRLLLAALDEARAALARAERENERLRGEVGLYARRIGRAVYLARQHGLVLNAADLDSPGQVVFERHYRRAALAGREREEGT